MKVLGIDPGTIITGWGIVETTRNGMLCHVSDGEIKARPGIPLWERLVFISDSLRKVIEDYKPDHCSVESIFFAKNAKSALVLGHARGVVFLKAADAGLSIHEYSPARVKESLTGYGRADKLQVEKMVSVLLGKKDISGPNAADALAMAICHIHHAGKNVMHKRA